MQKNGDMNEFILTENAKKIEHITLQDAKAVLERGLKYFIGDNYQWLPEYDKVVDWLTDNNHRGLLVFGSNGRGKSVICTKILPVIFKFYLKLDYFYIDAADLSVANRNDLDYYYLHYSQSPIIIDDIGVESMAGNYGEKIDLVSEIIDKCEKNKRLIILTTNLTPSALTERYGLRAYDRLKGITRSIKFNGDSLRG